MWITLVLGTIEPGAVPLYVGNPPFYQRWSATAIRLSYGIVYD